MMNAFLILLICLCQPAVGSPDHTMINRYRDMVADNLRFLDKGGFPREPVSGSPWMTVVTKDRRAVLICPEDGVGDAILIFADGSIERKVATQGGQKLSCYDTIKPHDGKKWVESNFGAGWEELAIDGDGARSTTIAKYFADTFYRAAHEVGALREGTGPTRPKPQK